MVISLIYVCQRATSSDLSSAAMDDLVTQWGERNKKLGVRGALLVTTHHIAQILEGPEQAVDQFLADVRDAPGHGKITVIERRPIEAYRFTDWCFAYWGTATYMDEKIATVLAKHDALAEIADTGQLFDLMRLLARGSQEQEGPIGNPPRH